MSSRGGVEAVPIRGVPEGEVSRPPCTIRGKVPPYFCLSHMELLADEEAVKKHMNDPSRFGNWRKARKENP